METTQILYGENGQRQCLVDRINPTSIYRGAMDIGRFSVITDKVIKRDGFDNYSPTLCIPSKKHLTVLVGIPENISQQEAARKWVIKRVKADEEYFLAYRSGKNEVTVEWHRPGKKVEECMLHY
jgi:hypothetical protein